MILVHLTSSTFFGGPERQMLGLATALPERFRSVFLSFSEDGKCAAFLDRARDQGFKAEALNHDTPHLHAAIGELTMRLRGMGAHVLCCHGYKATLIGRLAARRVKIPVISISRGWTGETFRVCWYEAMERLTLRWMDRIVCVSEGQAAKVRRAGVPLDRITDARNAIRTDRFAKNRAEAREVLRSLFSQPPRQFVAAAGRLSPEKGIGVLIEAAALVGDRDRSIGFVVFGDGQLRAELTRAITSQGLSDRFVLAGFRPDLDHLFPGFDLLALPSFTEGLPNVVLEAFSAGVPVVASAVGGTPEVVIDGENGYLVPPDDPSALATRICETLSNEDHRLAMGGRGRERVRSQFTFEAQSLEYQRLFHELVRDPVGASRNLLAFSTALQTPGAPAETQAR